MSTEQMREEFEEACRKGLLNGGLAKFPNGEYTSSLTHSVWIGWKSSRESILVELPSPHAHVIWIQAGHGPDDYCDDVAISHSEKDKCCDGSERYRVFSEFEVLEMFRAAGITVKE